MSPADKMQQIIRDDVRARHGLKPLPPVTTVREFQRQEADLDIKLEGLRARAALMPVVAKPEAVPEEPIAVAVQAVARPGFTGFNRAGQRWPSAAPRFVRVSPRMLAELSAETMLAVCPLAGPAAEHAGLELLDLPAGRRSKALPVSVMPAIGTEQDALDAAENNLDLAGRMLADHRAKISQLALPREEAEVALHFAFSEYNPADASKGALRNVESSKLRLDAIEAKLAKDTAFLEALRDHLAEAEKARDVAWLNLQRSKYGAEGWRRRHADRLELVGRATSEAARLMAEVDADAESFAVPEDVRKRALAMGLQPPTPISPLAIGATLAAFSARTRMLPSVRAVQAVDPTERREALLPWLDTLVTRLERHAGVEGRERGERAERCRIALRDAACPLDARERAEVARELDLRSELEARAESEAMKIEDQRAPGGFRIATAEETARARELSVATSAPRPQVPAPNGTQWSRDKSGPPGMGSSCP